MVTICTTSLTFNNSTFCPHTVFICFVWISEQTAIISLYSINWLACITQAQCVYCAVRTVFTYNFTGTNKPNTDITTLSRCQHCLYADLWTEKRTFEEISSTAILWLPLKVRQSSRGRNARRVINRRCPESWLPFTEFPFHECDDHCNLRSSLSTKGRAIANHVTSYCT